MSLSADHYEAGPLPAHSSVPVHDQLLIREDSICILTSYLRHVTCVVLCEICSILLLTTDHCARNWHGHVWGRSRGQLGSEVVKLWDQNFDVQFRFGSSVFAQLVINACPFWKDETIWNKLPTKIIALQKVQDAQPQVLLVVPFLQALL